MVREINGKSIIHIFIQKLHYSILIFNPLTQSEVEVESVILFLSVTYVPWFIKESFYLSITSKIYLSVVFWFLRKSLKGLWEFHPVKDHEWPFTMLILLS